jgi:hypothetical protein
MAARGYASRAAGSGGARSRQEAHLGLQPFTDDAGPLLSVVRPGFREAVIGNFITLDVERAWRNSSRIIRLLTIRFVPKNTP